MKLAGKCALITGAYSGIGRALAMDLANRGCDLALRDRDEIGLKSTLESLLDFLQRRLTSHLLDIADQKQVAAASEELLASHDQVNLLFNNAGMSLIDYFKD